MNAQLNEPAARRDNFDALRLLAALAVVIGHAFVLTDAGSVPRVFGIPLHTLGVAIFFSISGYLVSGSWERSPSTKRFLWHRCLRLFPALIVVVLVTVFIIGPLVSSLALTEYFASPVTYGYLWTVTLFAQYDLPGVFTGGWHETSAVNGSLWSLGVEFLCYLMVLAIGHLPKRTRSIGYLAIAALAVTVSLLARADVIPWLTTIAPSIEMVVFFLVAAALRATGVAVTVLRAAGMLVLWAVAFIVLPELSFLIALIAVPIAVLAFGRAETPVLRSVHRIGDLSYGTYLWSYPVQQLVIERFDPLPLGVNLAVVVAIALLLAVLSWNLIEKPALTLKSGVPFAPWLRAPAPAG